MKEKIFLVLMLLAFILTPISGQLSTVDKITMVNNNTLDLNESDSLYWLIKGNALLNESKFNESFDAYNKSIELDQSYAEAWNGKGLALESQALAIQSHTGSQCLARRGKMDEAVKAFDKAIQLEPDYAEAYYNKGYALYRSGKFDEAIQAFDTAIRLEPDFAQAHFNKGMALLDQGRLDEAIQAYDKTVQIEPDFTLPNYYKAIIQGAILRGQGKYDEAIQAFDKAIQIKPDHAEAYSNKAFVLRQLGKYEESLQAYDKAIQRISDDYYITNASLYIGKGLTLDRLARASGKKIAINKTNETQWYVCSV
jgi:tetratricopeptide (TPR) repeat protein